jgi:hypothetical protein
MQQLFVIQFHSLPGQQFLSKSRYSFGQLGKKPISWSRHTSSWGFSQVPRIVHGIKVHSTVFVHVGLAKWRMDLGMLLQTFHAFAFPIVSIRSANRSSTSVCSLDCLLISSNPYFLSQCSFFVWLVCHVPDSVRLLTDLFIYQPSSSLFVFFVWVVSRFALHQPLDSTTKSQHQQRFEVQPMVRKSVQETFSRFSI